jgi:hypothetical protein
MQYIYKDGAFVEFIENRKPVKYRKRGPGGVRLYSLNDLPAEVQYQIRSANEDYEYSERSRRGQEEAEDRATAQEELRYLRRTHPRGTWFAWTNKGWEPRRRNRRGEYD